VLSKDKLSAANINDVLRVILNLQIELIALAMLVTRLSVTSLQIKQRLSLKTQIVE